MIIILYRWSITPGKEKQFEDNWAIVTEAIRKECGSYGSRLHVNEKNEYVGYAQWPDLETRARCKPLSASFVDGRALMADAIFESYPEEALTVRTDLLGRW